jgi:hypothetical protein
MASGAGTARVRAGALRPFAVGRWRARQLASHRRRQQLSPPLPSGRERLAFPRDVEFQPTRTGPGFVATILESTATRKAAVLFQSEDRSPSPSLA